MIRVVGIPGSLRQGSYTYLATRLALDAAAAAGAEVELVDLRDVPLPFCDARDDQETLSPEVYRLRALVGGAAGLILGSPEYHGSFSGVLKNALDLLSRDELEGKMVGLVAVAGGAGGSGALEHLRGVMRAVHAWVIPKQVVIPEASRHFDGSGSLTDARLGSRLAEVGRDVAKYARVHAESGLIPFPIEV